MTETTKKRRGPVGRLDLDTIVAAGLTIAARPATRSISVRDLGTHLQADPTAIYRHVRNKDGLIQVLLDRITGMTVDRITVDPSDWREYLRQSSQYTFDVFMEYPAIGAEATRLSSEGTQELRVVEGILTAFASAGLNPADRLRYFGIWSVYVLSFCAGAARERMDSGDPQEPSYWLDRDLSQAGGDYPQVAAAREGLLELTDVGAYRDGVNLILESALAAAGAALADRGDRDPDRTPAIGDRRSPMNVEETAT